MNQALAERKLQMFKKTYGIDGMSKDEALDLAIQADQFAKDCGPFDPASSKFAEDARRYFEIAECLEVLEHAVRLI
jgi:hypothetical protein